MVDAAVTAMAYSALVSTTSQAPFIEQGRPYAVGEVSSGYATSLDTAGGFVVKLPSFREKSPGTSGAFLLVRAPKLIFSSRLAATNHPASPSHDVTMMRDGCSDRITRNKAYHHADSKNGENELRYVRITHGKI
jgi:hypothetical protein